MIAILDADNERHRFEFWDDQNLTKKRARSPNVYAFARRRWPSQEIQVNSSRMGPVRTGLSAMIARTEGVDLGLPTLERAVAAWIDAGDEQPIRRWLERALDQDGLPRDTAVTDWVECLSLLSAAQRTGRSPWPVDFDARIEGLLRFVLRFCRPTGRPVFSACAVRPDTNRVLRDWATSLADPGLATVVNWWFPSDSKGQTFAAPPLPAWSMSGRPLAMLRANWATKGDLLAIDHRHRDDRCAFELLGRGQTWLGPSWRSVALNEPVTAARPTCWQSSSSADLLEWAFRVGETRAVRLAVLLRGRCLALIGEQVDGKTLSHEIRLAIPEGVTVEPIAESQALTLTAKGGRARARAFPLALPGRPDNTASGALEHAGNEVVLRQSARGRRSWLPLVVSWDPERNRKPAHWRTLTVSEKSKVCPPDVAFAARLSWGRDETLLVYRSLARPALRAFLGHQTRARFLIARFTSDGKVEPIVKLDE